MPILPFLVFLIHIALPRRRRDLLPGSVPSVFERRPNSGVQTSNRRKAVYTEAPVQVYIKADPGLNKTKSVQIFDASWIKVGTNAMNKKQIITDQQQS